MEYRMGLRVAFKEFLDKDNGGLKHRIKILKWEIKYAWRRAMYGYDDVDIFDLDHSLIKRIIVLLEEYKKYNNCLWFCPEGYELGTYDINTNHNILNKEQVNVIIDTMIFHFKMSDENYVEKKLYGSNIYDKDYKVGCRSYQDIKRIRNVMKQNQDMGMDLLKMFLNDLWY